MIHLPPLSRDQVRSVDKTAIEEYGISGLVLMENAGRGAAEVIAESAGEGEIVILCGRGNNAGDGYVIARHLELLGCAVRIVSLVELESLNGDAEVNAKIALKSKIEIRIVSDPDQLAPAMSTADTLVECLLGTGAHGAPRGLIADAIRQANRIAAVRVAIDIPAGLHCDTGVASDPTLIADHTISFVAAKVGFDRNDAVQVVGQVHVVGIGVPKHLLDQIKATCQ